MPQVQSQPFNRAVAITKSDTVNYDGSTYSASTATKAFPAEAVYVGAAGVVALVSENGDVNNFTANAGEILPYKSIRVNSTNTTASLMNALYTV